MICLICNQEFTNQSFGNHLRIHKINVNEYYRKYLKTDNESGKCNNCGKDLKFKIDGTIPQYCSLKCSNSDPKKISKIKDICIIRYGGISSLCSSIIKDKIKTVMLEKYGGFGVGSEIIRKKIIETNRSLCGHDYQNSTNEHKNKIRNSCIKKYGVDSVFKLDETKQKIKDTCIDHFGVSNYAMTNDHKENVRNLRIKRIEDQYLNGEPLTPNIGNNERICFQELEKLIQYQIIKQERISGFFIDGYIKELNLAIEFDERSHFELNGSLKFCDIERQKILEYELKCEFFRIKESDWIENKDCIINSFLEKVKQYECRSN